MMAKVIAEIVIVPYGTGTTSLSGYVAGVERKLKEYGLKTMLTPMGTIVEGRRMTGVTVLARFRPLTDFDGQQLATLALGRDRRYSAGLRSAAENARDNYLIITSGGVAAEPPTALARHTRRLRSLFKRRSPLSA